MSQKCIVCSTTKNLTRHHIIPLNFLKFMSFEDAVKYEELVVICRSCHDRYEDKAKGLKAKLLKEYGISTIRPKEEHIRAIAKAVVKFNQQKANIPVEVIESYKQEIIEYFGGLNLDAALKLESDRSLQWKALLEKIEDLEAFAQLWRNDFQSFLNNKNRKKQKK